GVSRRAGAWRRSDDLGARSGKRLGTNRGLGLARRRRYRAVCDRGQILIFCAQNQDLTPSSCEPTNSSRRTACSAASISAAFSPIMIDAAFVLPLTTFGITLASATRSLSTPITSSCEFTTLPIRQLVVGWYTVNE